MGPQAPEEAHPGIPAAVKNLIGIDMTYSPVRNYIVPGLDSWLIAEGKGKVRLFRSSRQYAGEITPHSHRFNFSCYVMKGHVINQTYLIASPLAGDLFAKRALDYTGDIGEFDVAHTSKPMPYVRVDERHDVGDWYSMEADEIHSIYFSKGAEVLFFEGPTTTSRSHVLLPWVAGELIDNMDCSAPWMYKHE